MKIVVTVKLAAALDESATVRDGVVDDSDLDWDVNEWDMFAVEAALELRESAGDGEVVIVSVGGDQVPEGLLSCLAMGADRAVHIEVEEEASTLDAIAVARLLAAIIGPEEPDLVLSGVQSSDFASAATGTAVAGLLDLRHVAVVRDVVAVEGHLEVQRELEGGLVERLRIGLPAALTVQTGANEPRYATLRSIRQASSKERRTVSPAELGFDGGSLASLAASRTTALAEPPVRTSAAMIEGSAQDIAAQIVSIVKAKVT